MPRAAQAVVNDSLIGNPMNLSLVSNARGGKIALYYSRLNCKLTLACGGESDYSTPTECRTTIVTLGVISKQIEENKNHLYITGCIPDVALFGTQHGF